MSDFEVLARVARLDEGVLTLAEFEDWFVAATWDCDSPLIREVTGVLAESAGNGGDDVALRELSRLLRGPITVLNGIAIREHEQDLDGSHLGGLMNVTFYFEGETGKVWRKKVKGRYRMRDVDAWVEQRSSGA